MALWTLSPIDTGEPITIVKSELAVRVYNVCVLPVDWIMIMRRIGAMLVAVVVTISKKCCSAQNPGAGHRGTVTLS